jgi:hypothetical protein
LSGAPACKETLAGTDKSIKYKTYHCGLGAEGDPCTATISDLSATPSVSKPFLIRSPELSGNYQQIHLVTEQEKLGEEMAVEICRQNICFILVGFFNVQ